MQTFQSSNHDEELVRTALLFTDYVVMLRPQADSKNSHKSDGKSEETALWFKKLNFELINQSNAKNRHEGVVHLNPILVGGGQICPP